MMIHQKLNGLASVLWKTALITLKRGYIINHMILVTFETNSKQNQPPTWNVGLLMMSFGVQRSSINLLPLCPPNAVCFLHTEGIERRVHLLQQKQTWPTHMHQYPTEFKENLVKFMVNAIPNSPFKSRGIKSLNPNELIVSTSLTSTQRSSSQSCRSGFATIFSKAASSSSAPNGRVFLGQYS